MGDDDILDEFSEFEYDAGFENYRRPGRPRRDKVRSKRLDVRLSDEANDMLAYIINTSNETKTDSIERAIRMLYNLKKCQNND